MAATDFSLSGTSKRDEEYQQKNQGLQSINYTNHQLSQSNIEFLLENELRVATFQLQVATKVYYCHFAIDKKFHSRIILCWSRLTQ